jgi:hypothetical protein
MAPMRNITLLPSAKVPVIYDGGDTMTTEWYRFFWNIYGFTGTGVIPVDKGGTGLDTIDNHQIIIGNANNVFEPASFSSSSINISYPSGYVNLELGTSTVTPGTYGSATQVGVFTVNQYGVLTAASNTLIGINANQIVSGTIASARISGSYTGITGVGILTTGTWNATTIGSAYGGTGFSTYATGDLIYASASNTLSKLAAGTNGYVLTLSGGVPTWASSTGGVTTFSAGTTGFSPSSASTGAITLSGTLNVSNGGSGQSTYTDGQLLIGNSTGNTLNKATLTAGAGISITNGSGSITVTAIGGASITSYTYTATQGQTVFSGLSYTPGNNGLSVFVNGSKQITSTNYTETNTTTVTFTAGLNVGDLVEMEVIAAVTGLGGVTGVTATSPIASTGGATPTISISQATTSTNGYLSSTDWNTFNNKGSGTVTSVTATSPVTSSGGSAPVIAMPVATTSVNGYLSSTDWTTFNGKQDLLVSGTNIKTVGGTSLLGSGDVNTIGNSTNSTNAVNIGVTDDTTTNSNYFVTFVAASSGNTPIKTSASKLKYNPSTGALTASIIYIAP